MKILVERKQTHSAATTMPVHFAGALRKEQNNRERKRSAHGRATVKLRLHALCLKCVTFFPTYAGYE